MKKWKQLAKQLDIEIYSKRILSFYKSFIDSVKKQDNSLFFWSMGGAFRKVIQNRGIGKSDVDFFVQTTDDYLKFCRVLENLGYISLPNESSNCYRSPLGGSVLIQLSRTDYMLFNFYEDGLDNINNVLSYFRRKTYSFHPRHTTYWTDYTNSAISLDSNYNLYYHPDFFKDCESNILEAVNRDKKLLCDSIEKILTDFSQNKKVNNLIKNMVMNVNSNITYGHRMDKFVTEGWNVSFLDNINIEKIVEAEKKIKKEIIVDSPIKKDFDYDEVVENWGAGKNTKQINEDNSEFKVIKKKKKDSYDDITDSWGSNLTNDLED